jgi:hypothetical protein
MSVLTVCQNAARVLSFGVPTTIVGNNDDLAKKLLEALVASGKDRRRSKQWPQLIKTGTLTLSDGVATPTMPADIMAFINNTFWDTTEQRPMDGPLTPAQWANIKWGVVNVGPFKKFRIAGNIATKRFELDPVPTSGDAGSEIKFLYLSSDWLLPKLWVTATAYNQFETVSNTSGIIYYARTSGTSGATMPDATTGTDSDGSLLWEVYTDKYERPTNDADIVLFDEELLEHDIVWRMRKNAGMDYAEFKADADKLWADYYVQISGAPTLRIGGTNDLFLVNYNNVPDTGYGV